MDILQIKSIYLKTHVTAIKFYKSEYIFTASGGNLNIYHWNTNTKTICLPIFQHQTIHGILFNEENECMLYGGKDVCVLQICMIDNMMHTTTKNNYSLEDWILQAKYFKNNVLFVTAHNVAILCDEKTMFESERFNCDEKCILYSAEIVIDKTKDKNKSIVLGGTVFSEIIIWKTLDSDKSNKVLHRLRGHKGVIFSIAFDKNLKKIASTSDDRSLRIWNIEDCERFKNDSLNWDNIIIQLAYSAFGHTDRVRSCIILSELKIIITIGEDSMICTWDMNGVLIAKKSSHQSGPIWAFDVDITHEMIATGGCDGGILLHKLVQLPQKPLPLLMGLPNSVKNELTPRKLLYTSKGTLLCVLYNGDFMQYCYTKKNWTIIDNMIEMSSYCLIDTKFHYILVCGLNGNLRLYKENEIDISIIVKTKLFSDRIVSGVLTSKSSIIICTELGKIYSYKINHDKIIKCDDFIMPRSNEPWFTAADEYKCHLILGDRRGNLHLFKRGLLLPVYTITKAHCHLGVTYITVNNDKIVSMGRDGRLLEYHIVNDNLLILSCSKFDFKWIERYIIHGGFQILCGFTASKFIIYSSNEVVWEVNCGGGHRSWDVYIFNNEVKFSFVKNSIVHEICCKLSDILKLPVEESFVGKEINSLKTLYSKDCPNSLFITGGEDTVLTIYYFNTDQIVVSKLLSIQSHLSSIKTIEYIKLFENEINEESYIIISGGSRAQICVSEININLSEVTPIIRTKYLANHMLNGFDFDKKQQSKSISAQDTRYMSLSIVPKLTNDTYTKETLNIILPTGCSDGILRIFSVKNIKSSLIITLLAEGNNDKCILHVHSLAINLQNNNYVVVFTLDTIGVLKIWNITALHEENISSAEYSLLRIQPEVQWKIHQNGINSYDMKMLGNGRYLLATGGDDNAIKLTLVICYIDKVLCIKRKCLWENCTTHCAQITGIVFYGKFILSTSVDQRISIFIWDVTELDNIKCQFKTQCHTTVADIQGIQILNETRFVGGKYLYCYYGSQILVQFNIFQLKHSNLCVWKGHSNSGDSIGIEKQMKQLLKCYINYKLFINKYYKISIFYLLT